MPVKFGILGVAHLHAFGYVKGIRECPGAEYIGVWDEDGQRSGKFVSAVRGITYKSAEALLDDVDAVVVCSENTTHAKYIRLAAQAGKHVLCEKPLVTDAEEGERLLEFVAQKGVKLMTAFPCRYSPAFTRMVERVRSGELGTIRAICATNRGRCPFDWFVEKSKSGGGAMIDHVVHVADLLRILLGEEAARVQAQIGHNMYGKDWEDTAMLTIEFPSGVFATLDSSWSRPASFKTWGDVTMTVVGDRGLIEVDLFNQSWDVYRNSSNPSHNLGFFGSDTDSLLVADFMRAIVEDREPTVTGHDGLQAAKWALAGYHSVQEGQPVAVG